MNESTVEPDHVASFEVQSGAEHVGPKSRRIEMPGNYAIYEKIGSYERCVSFQTLDELNAYMNWRELS